MALHVEPSPGVAPEPHPKAPEREPLPPGILPNITDTDPPPLHPATEVGDGYVRVNQEKLHPQHAPAAQQPHAAHQGAAGHR